MQRFEAIELGLQRARLTGREPGHTFDVVDLGLAGDGVEASEIGVFRRHHQLAAAVEGHVMSGEKEIEQAASLHAQPRPQRTGGIVEPAVDDLGIARRHALADGPIGL